MGLAWEGEAQRVIKKTVPSGPWRVFDGRELPDVQASAAAAGIDLGQVPSLVGQYTDDTESSLSLIDSMTTLGGLHARHAALSMAVWWARGGHGGYSGYTHQKMIALRQGTPLEELDLPTAESMPGGSFGNGGAMRIPPVGIAFRSWVGDIGQEMDASEKTAFREVVADAIKATHTHEEAIDGAFILAVAVGQAAKADRDVLDTLDPVAWLRSLAALATTHPLGDNLASVADALHSQAVGGEEESQDDMYSPVDREVTSAWTEKWFQIRTSDALPPVLYMVAKYGIGPNARPAEALVRTVALGGDADTLGAMVGALLGAIHGPDWILPEWRDAWEDDADALSLSLALSRLGEGITHIPSDDDAANQASDQLLLLLQSLPIPSRHG